VSRVRTSLAVTAAATLGAGALAYAALWPESQLFGETLIAGADPRAVLFTFDDGPNPRITEPLLDLLAAKGVRATFFLIGAYIQQQRALVRRMHEAGHVLGNHTMHHAFLAGAGPARVRAELEDCNAALEDAIGAPVRYFRPPHGARRPDVLRTARELGLTPVLWNVTCFDWSTGQTAARIFHHGLTGIDKQQRRGRGANILLHDGSQGGIGANREATLAAVPLLIDYARASGCRFQTVADAALQ
jgi:peptidoglycan/xylan/chitin deacetylase (PgdA/CDA1 family)